jgi:DNA-binding Lrp family transcriptional regulator
MQTYILISCTPGSEKKIISMLKKMSEVIEVNGIMGKYDIFVKISARGPKQIDSAVLKLRDIAGIISSYSMPVLYGQGGTIIDEEK